MVGLSAIQTSNDEAKENIMDLRAGTQQKKESVNNSSIVMLDRTSDLGFVKTSHGNKVVVGVHGNHQEIRSIQGSQYHLKQHYKKELKTLLETFPQWSEDDLMAALQESEFDVQLVASRISEGLVSTWNEVRKKPPASLSKETDTRSPRKSSEQGHQPHRGVDKGDMKPKKVRGPASLQDSRKKSLRKEVTTSPIEKIASTPPTQAKVAWSKIVQKEQNLNSAEPPNKSEGQTLEDTKAKASVARNAPPEGGRNSVATPEAVIFKKDDEEGSVTRTSEIPIEGMRQSGSKTQDIPVVMPPLKSVGNLELRFGSLGLGGLDESSLAKENESTSIVHSLTSASSIAQNKSSVPVVPPSATPRLPGSMLSETTSKSQTTRPMDRAPLNQESSAGRSVPEMQTSSAGAAPSVHQYSGYVPGHVGPFGIPMPSLPQYNHLYEGADANVPSRNTHIPYDPSAYHQRQTDSTKVNDIHASLGNLQGGSSQPSTTQSMPAMSHQQYAPSAAMQYYYPYYAMPAPGQFASYPSSYGQPFKGVYPLYSQGHTSKPLAAGTNFGSQTAQHHLMGYSLQPHYHQQPPQHEEPDAKAPGYPANYYSQAAFQPYLPTTLGSTSKSGSSSFTSTSIAPVPGSESKLASDKHYATVPSVGMPYYGSPGMNAPSTQYGMYHGQSLQAPQYQIQQQTQPQQATQHPYAPPLRQFWQG